MPTIVFNLIFLAKSLVFIKKHNGLMFLNYQVVFLFHYDFSKQIFVIKIIVILFFLNDGTLLNLFFHHSEPKKWYAITTGLELP